MKKLLEAAVLAGVLLLASGCGSAEVPENKETYAYASYAHPEMVGAIDISHHFIIPYTPAEYKGCCNRFWR
uniref:hypothetical protein n=1 Tax=Eisenbergiella tayi TaxID=1432052 RepID=UPI003FED57BB